MTKIILIIVVFVLFAAYNSFFNKERNGTIRGLGQVFKLLVSLIIALSLVVLILLLIK